MLEANSCILAGKETWKKFCDDVARAIVKTLGAISFMNYKSGAF